MERVFCIIYDIYILYVLDVVFVVVNVIYDLRNCFLLERNNFGDVCLKYYVKVDLEEFEMFFCYVDFKGLIGWISFD